MKLIYKKIEFKTRTFMAKLVLETDSEDAWNLYNLISLGDLVRGVCHRKIQKDTFTGLVSNVKKKLSLTLKVTSVAFDGEAEVIRIGGTVAQENKWVKMGSYQSLEIQAPKSVTIIKPNFDIMHVKKLREITDDANKCRVGAIVMQEGIAHLFLMGAQTSKLLAKVEKRISKKKGFPGQHSTQTEKFY